MINRNIASYDAALLHLCLIPPLPLTPLANVVRVSLNVFPFEYLQY